MRKSKPEKKEQIPEMLFIRFGSSYVVNAYWQTGIANKFPTNPIITTTITDFTIILNNIANLEYCPNKTFETMVVSQ